MNISVVIALPSRAQAVELNVEDSCTARQAVELAVQNGLDLTGTGVAADTVKLGVYGEHVNDDAELADGDRVEIYRPLQQDPMERRRQHAASEPGRFPKRRK